MKKIGSAEFFKANILTKTLKKHITFELNVTLMNQMNSSVKLRFKNVSGKMRMF